MAFHAQRQHPTCKPDGTCDSTTAAVKFITNGRPPVRGAPFADPCMLDDGKAAASAMRVYKAAAHQSPGANRAGWHYPQARMLSLWQDVQRRNNSGSRPSRW